jgi:ribosomal protein S13
LRGWHGFEDWLKGTKVTGNIAKYDHVGCNQYTRSTLIAFDVGVARKNNASRIKNHRNYKGHKRSNFIAVKSKFTKTGLKNQRIKTVPPVERMIIN